MQSFDETFDGGLILPRGMTDKVATLVEQAGSRLDVTDERSEGTTQEFAFTATLSAEQREAVEASMSSGDRMPDDLVLPGGQVVGHGPVDDVG